jgi:cell division protein ZapD
VKQSRSRAFLHRQQNPENALVLYEYPFNEGIRTMLRLEHLFDRMNGLIARDAPVDHHYALASMFEIMDVAARADLKSDVLKELERHKNVFLGYRGNPAISEQALDAVIERIDAAFKELNESPGKAGQALTSNEWLMSIRSRIGIPGGTCAFDLPAYFAWQQYPPEARRAALQRWTSTLAPLSDALRVLLGLLRESGVPHKVIANDGQYQQSLPQARTYHLLRVKLPLEADLVPEISGHRLMVSIRLMRADAEGRLRPAAEDVAFELALCS